MKKRESIRDIIYSEYLRAALLPILIIEVALLIMYFTMSGYVAAKTKTTLLSEAKQNIQEITLREVKNINQTIGDISAFAEILQKEDTRILTSAAPVSLPNGTPTFGKAPNGVYYKTANNGGSSLFYSNLSDINKDRAAKALKTEAFDPLFKAVYESNPRNVGVYFNSYDSMCRYYPFLDNVYDVFPADMNIPKYNFYYLADQIHNSGKKPVWTDAYLDPAGQGWMTSCIVPVYSKNDFLEGVVGIDVTIDKLIKNILNLELPWNAGAFLVDKNGVILAMPSDIENILGMKELRQKVYNSKITQDTLKPEEFNLFKNGNPEIVNAMKVLFEEGSNLYEFNIGQKKYIAARGKITSTDWRLIVLVDEDVVFQPIYKLDYLSKKIGFIAFGFMLLFYILFFSFLMYKSKRIANKIATPISELAKYTEDVKFALTEEKSCLKKVDITEIDILVENFNKMDEELKTLYAELEQKVSDRTYELDEKNLTLEKALKELENAQTQIIMQEKMVGLGQLAAGVAHEINNPMSFVFSNLSTLQNYMSKLTDTLDNVLVTVSEIFKEDPKYAEFQTQLAALKKQQKYDYIVSDSKDLLAETLGGAERVRKIVENLRGFAHPTEEVIESTNLNEEIDKSLDLVWNELKYDVEVVKEYDTLPPVLCNKGKMVQVFVNLLMNARQAMFDKENAKITLRTYSQDKRVFLEFEDNGSGIKKELMSKVLDPFFTTKEVGKGTGLGLSIVHRIIADHEGHINVESEEGQGTKITIDLPVAVISV